MQRWGKHQSLWRENTSRARFPSLQGEREADVVVVGAGITGVVTAFLLRNSGLKVILVTAGSVADGCTGFSTGHLTQVLDSDFKHLTSSFGKESIKKVIDSLGASINFIEESAQHLGIDCDFSRVSGFKFAENDDGMNLLTQELKVAKELGLEVVKRANALEFKNQAMFDPFKYTVGLAKTFVDNGGEIFENSHIESVDDSKSCVVTSENGSVKAKHIVLATHSPIGVYVSLQTRIAPYFSYVMAVKLKNPPAEGLYWDTNNPYHYFRPHGDYWIIGGCDHKTGQVPAPLERYIELEDYIYRHFDVAEICNYWGDELYESVDGLPYIGKIPFTHGIYTATGFSGVGLTFGTLAGTIISDLICGRTHEYSHLYDPSRIKPLASASSFVRENVNVAKWMLGDLFDYHKTTELNTLTVGEGKIIDGELGKLAVYHDEIEGLQAYSATCPHMSGTVHWNSAEKTWDCPCHGGRFSCTGEVIAGPPLENLEKIPFKTGRVPESNPGLIELADISPSPDLGVT